MLSKKSVSGLFFGLMLLSSSAFAQNTADNSTPPPQGQAMEQGSGAGTQANRPSRVPPQFAIAACNGKSVGTTCEVTGPNGTKTGTCVYTKNGS